MILAAFVSPGLFYAGAGAVSIPILIHLFARRRFRRIRWAAIDFLVEAERRNRRRIRLEEWVLLALRCLAVLFIGMVVARPFLTPTGLAAGWGGSRQTERVFVIDDSFSMGYQSEDGAWFDRANLAVRRILEVVRRETPDDTVTIVRMSAVDRPVESGAYLGDERAKELFARLDALTPTERSIDPATAMEGVADLLGRDSGIVNAAIYVISDFQRHNWVHPGDPSLQRWERQSGEVNHSPTSKGMGHPRAEAGILAPLVAWAGQDRAMRLVFINVGDEDAANTAIEELTIPAGRLVAGTTAMVRAVVDNHSDRSIDSLRLELTVGHITQPSKAADGLGSRQSASVDVEVEFLRAGWESVRAELPPDALPIDNVRHMATDVANAIRVLIVNGEPSADAFDDEVTFLATALRPEGELFSGNELVIVDEVELEDAGLDEFHAVILANVYRVSEPAVESLELFVRRGGGMIIFLGDQVDPSLYNSLLYRDGEGLLPAELTEIVSADDEAHLVIVDRLHPVVRGLSRGGDPLGIGRIPFFKYFDCVPYARAPVDAPEDEGGSGPPETRPSGSVPAARIIAMFDDAQQRPAL
ncbi:MAG: BatA domain-containing protein, partial [Planctomycetota bacterium]